jgi:hypothetical protein
MNTKLTKLLLVMLGAPLMGGCFHPYITAVDLNNPNAPEGMPYYLPKPYIIISKNIRYIPTPTVGLTETASIPNMFDTGPQNQGGSNGTSGGGGSGGGGSTNTPPTNSGGKQKTGGGSGSSSNVVQAAKVPSDQNSNNTNAPSGNQDNSQSPGPSATPIYNGQVLGPASITVVPSAPIPDGLTPQTFFTYQIMFLPDLTQKYGLRIKGGVGEMRSTLNMVNGWMFTGPGPVYFKDSSTAEITTANWTGADSALESAAKIVSTIYGIPSIGGTGTSNKLQSAKVPGAPAGNEISDFAQIWIYEGSLSPDGKSMTWNLLKSSDHATATITRTYLGLESTQSPNGSGSVGTGGTSDDTHPKDSFPDVTKNVNELILSLGIQGLAGSSTSSQGNVYITTVNRAPTANEDKNLATGLKSLKVQLSAQQ